MLIWIWFCVKQLAVRLLRVSTGVLLAVTAALLQPRLLPRPELMRQRPAAPRLAICLPVLYLPVPAWPAVRA